MQSQWTLDSAPPAARAARRASLAAVLDAARAAWQALLARHARRQAALALGDLDDHMLRDVGAPGWLLRETQILREIEQNRLSHWLRS